MLATEHGFLRDAVHRSSRINPGPDKPNLVPARLGKRLYAAGATTITDYCQLLRQPESRDEFGQLIDVTSTNHTYLFRAGSHFDAMRSIILPDLVRRRATQAWPLLRGRSAACSGGQEPYSIAIELAEYFSRGAEWSWQIEATDLSSRILAKASAGFYPENAVKRLPTGCAKRYLQEGLGPQAGLYRARPALRQNLNFRHLNLVEGPSSFDQPFHFILCRNVMIHFDRTTPTELIERLKRLLVPGGYFIEGHSDSLSGIDHRLKKSVRPPTNCPPKPAVVLPSSPIRVLIGDDSAIVHSFVTPALSADPAFTVFGTASDPVEALTNILERKPQAITLDIEMPRMDGLTFLASLTREHALPAIVMSSLNQRGSEQALGALRLGAVEMFCKSGGRYSFGQLVPDLIRAVKVAAESRPGRRSARALALPPATPAALKPVAPPAPSRGESSRLIVLDASAGGTEALREVMTALPAGLPPITIVPPLPAHFSRAFTDRLGQLRAFPGREAANGDKLARGTALVAPGDFHPFRDRRGGWPVTLDQGPALWHQRPAVDVMFRPIPQNLGNHVVAGVLTGMGKNGAAGLLRPRGHGAMAFSQDEASSVVYGLPREAREQGGFAVPLPLENIAAPIVRLAATPPTRAAAR